MSKRSSRVPIALATVMEGAAHPGNSTKPSGKMQELECWCNFPLLSCVVGSSEGLDCEEVANAAGRRRCGTSSSMACVSPQSSDVTQGTSFRSFDGPRVFEAAYGAGSTSFFCICFFCSNFFFLLTRNQARKTQSITAPIELTDPTIGALGVDVDGELDSVG